MYSIHALVELVKKNDNRTLFKSLYIVSFKPNDLQNGMNIPTLSTCLP